MKKFKVYDLYEGPDCIGYADTVAEVRKIARQQYFDTDGECTIYYLELDPVSKKYKRETAKFLPVI